MDNTALINDLETLADWPEAALDAWLEYNPINRNANETDEDLRQRRFEAWTASGARAEAEEATADLAAQIAQNTLARLRGGPFATATCVPSTPFSIDQAALSEWWTDQVAVSATLVSEIFDNAALAVEEFVHDGGRWLKTTRPSLGLQTHVTHYDGVADGFVLAAYDSTWPQCPHRLCVATGYISADDVKRDVDAGEFASSIIEIANGLFTAATALRVSQ